MKVFYDYKNIPDKFLSSIVTIGMFDGIHIGHKHIIEKIIDLKKERKYQKTVLITFDPHPETFLKKSKVSLKIMSLEHRLLFFEKLGIDIVIVLKFNDYLSKMFPEDFIKEILLPIKTQYICVGDNFFFGFNKKGDKNVLKNICDKYKIGLNIVKPILKNKDIISSTLIRKLILYGDIKNAEEMLGHKFSILGTVIHGEKRGRKLGIPTANIDSNHELIPPKGVYIVNVNIDKECFIGLLNIGINPTFCINIDNIKKIELYILDFSGDLYGKSVEIFFKKKIREEIKFKNIEDFKKQVAIDIQKTREFYQKTFV